MIQSLLKAIKLLDCFYEKHELSLLELVKLSEMPKSTVFRLVNTLEEAGFLVKVKYSSYDVKYKLGLKLLELGKLVGSQLDFREIALPYMRELNEKLNETVQLAVTEDNKEVNVVEKLDSSKRVRIVVKIGDRAPLYAGSASKLLLANLHKSTQNQYLQTTKLKKIGKNTIVEIDKLNNELNKIRKNGYSISKEEIYKDSTGFSAPIYNSSGKVIAALSVSIPSAEYSKEKADYILKKLINSTKQISYELGYR